MSKLFTKLFMLCAMLTTIGMVQAEDKVPITIFDFSEGDGGWIVKDFTSLSSGHAEINWKWNESAYYNLSAGLWLSTRGNVGEAAIRNSIMYSPVIDLANKAEVEMYVTLMQAWSGDGNNLNWCYVQDVDSLDITEIEDTVLIQEWKKSWAIDVQANNFVEMGLSAKPSDKNGFTAGPLNLAKFDGRKVRIGIHMWNQVDGTAEVNYRVYAVKNVTVAALTADTQAPNGNIVKVDSIGNTFMRPYYNADEICKVHYAVMAKGESPADYDDLVNNLGTDKFVTSGSFNYNIPGTDKDFFVTGLTIDSEYTLSFVAEDYKENKSGVQSIDEKTIADLTAPSVTSIIPKNVLDITAEVMFTSDEVGTIRYRVYEAGLEPADYDQFFTGVGSILRHDVPVAADTTVLLEDLKLNTTYIVYAVVTDGTGNISAITKSETFMTQADVKAPIISSVTVDGISNHAATVKLIADEPTAGYGNVMCYWSATAADVTLTSDEVMTRKQSLASGRTSDLDSASYESSVAVNNLDLNTEYKIHVVLVDNSENISEVSTATFTTANEVERVAAFANLFNVEGQNYHFREVLKQEGAKDHWSLKPTATSGEHVGSAFVTRTNLSGKGEEAWCIVGPMNLSNLINLQLSTDLFKGYGGDGRNSLSLLMSKNYKTEEALDENNWVEVANVGDMTFPQKKLISFQKDVPVELGMDTLGVYVAIRFKHNSWALNYDIYNLKVFGDLASVPAPPIIDWVEVSDASSTNATVSFTADTYGRMFYYLVKDTGVTVEMPTLEIAKSGEGASAFGYRDYTAGNFIDQKFTIGGLDPSSKYYLFTTFRSNLFAWGEEVFYDEEVNVFNTAELAMTQCDTSMVYATSAIVKTSAETSGKLYYTVLPAGEEMPTSIDEIRSSFYKKGSVNYNITDGTSLEWEISNLNPYTEYDLYVTLGDNSGVYGSEISKISFTTQDLKVESMIADAPLQVSDTVQLFNVAFTVATSNKGKLYMIYTAADAAIPTADEVMAGTGAVRSLSANVEDPNETILVADSLSQEESTSFEAWFVIKSGNTVSKVYALNQTLAYTYTARFKVTDKNGTPLQGITVKVGENEMVTDNRGGVAFYELSPNGYAYEIKRSDLSHMIDGTVTILDKNETVEIMYDVTIGVEDLVIPTVGLYPNPSSDLTTLVLEKDAFVSIYNLSGTLVSKAFHAEGRSTMDVSSLDNGVYLLNVTYNNGLKNTIKLIKQ